MLAYVLALVIALGSLALYLAAFFFPEVHRKEDFIWSGIGLFYALVLWVCAGRITGGVLLGQLASVALLGWFGWQTLTLRREMASPENRTPISPELQAKLNSFSLPELGQKLQQQITSLLKKKDSDTQSFEPTPTSFKPPRDRKPSSVEPAVPLEIVTAELIETPSPTPAPVTMVVEPVADQAEISESPELVRPNPPAPELLEAAQPSALSETPAPSAEATIPIAEIAPEVELAPPAEPPGDGDPIMRQILVESDIAVAPTSPTEDDPTIRPNPPEADIVIEIDPINPENPPKLS